MSRTGRLPVWIYPIGPPVYPGSSPGVRSGPGTSRYAFYVSDLFGTYLYRLTDLTFVKGPFPLICHPILHVLFEGVPGVVWSRSGSNDPGVLQSSASAEGPVVVKGSSSPSSPLSETLNLLRPPLRDVLGLPDRSSSGVRGSTGLAIGTRGTPVVRERHTEYSGYS